jgi:hypothetical protein
MNYIKVYTMNKTHKTNALTSKATLDLGMHADDYPEAYEKLAPAEQAALLEWIRLTIKPVKTVAPSTSYGIKHTFEEVGFYISNGQFKGAMLAAGYAPVNPDELNWEFRIRPTGKRHQSKNGTVYHVDHLIPEEREDLDALARAGKRARVRRYDAYRKGNQ